MQIEELINLVKKKRPKDFEVWMKKHGLDDGVQKTLQEIADVEGITREAVRQRVKKTNQALVCYYKEMELKA